MWFTAVKFNVSKTVLGLLFLVGTLFAIEEPHVPSVKSPADPEAVFTTNRVSGLTFNVLLKKASGIIVPAHWTITDRVIVISNKTKNGLEITSVNLASLKKIVCTNWHADEIRPNLYRFYPGTYRLIGKKTYAYHGHLSFLDSLLLSEPPSHAYTIYFDRWIQGKKGVWRWKNNKATHFEYAFTHPLSNVVVEIRLNSSEEKHEE